LETASLEKGKDKTVNAVRPHQDAGLPDAAQFPEKLDLAEAGEVKAWELIDAHAGRYMPRRIRGSFRGRALG
jgi:hypothetical protein